MVRFAPVASAVLLLLVALLQVSAFCPVGRRSSRLAWSSSSSNGRQQLALTKLMATRGGVAGGKVRRWAELGVAETRLSPRAAIGLNPVIRFDFRSRAGAGGADAGGDGGGDGGRWGQARRTGLHCPVVRWV